MRIPPNSFCIGYYNPLKRYIYVTEEHIGERDSPRSRGNMIRKSAEYAKNTKNDN